MIPLKIFIVEDEGIVALDLQRRLTRLGHTVTGIVSTGERALEEIPKAVPDLVLSDIKLNASMDGIALANAVHSRFNLPVIFVTAYSDSETVSRVKSCETCGFIIKPFSDEELQATISIGFHQHELEAKLKQSEEQYRCLFDEAPVGYHEIDLEGNLVRVNRTELEMLGYDPRDMIGCPVWEFLEQKDLCRKAVMEKLAGGKVDPRPFERNYLHRDGRPIPMLVRDYPIRGPGGKLCGIRTTIQDISLLKEEQAKTRRMEESLRQAEKLENLGLIAGGLAHDLNNQMMAIQGNVSLTLLNQPPGADEARGYLEGALAACHRATALLRQVLVCAGYAKGEFKPLRLENIIREAAASAAKLAQSRTKLSIKLADGLPSVVGDESQIKQLLMILLTNSVEAVGNSGGEIRIEAGVEPVPGSDLDFEFILKNKNPIPRGQSCFFSVSDNGPGMPRETTAKLFDLFFSTKGVGRGLGLPTALGIVKNHGGEIQVKSAPGKGTTLRVILPAMISNP